MRARVLFNIVVFESFCLFNDFALGIGSKCDTQCMSD